LPLAVHIAGTVTHGSSPVSGLDVYFYDPDMNQIAHATTDASAWGSITQIRDCPDNGIRRSGFLTPTG
jgi:hypothetical protein